ncbi:hypothetical protein RND81_09G030600 [Saponaria officinalis]|uniref:Uncharacterized protein n=1 Tax=Saponaria officinalis TaxID=3572 RepID=A0AAW1II20_SAPOF
MLVTRLYNPTQPLSQQTTTLIKWWCDRLNIHSKEGSHLRLQALILPRRTLHLLLNHTPHKHPPTIHPYPKNPINAVQHDSNLSKRHMKSVSIRLPPLYKSTNKILI